MDHHALQRRRVLAATSVSYLIVLLDTSIVNVALNRLSVALQAPMSGLQWVMNAYTLAFASLLLSGGTLGDRLGAGRVYLAGLGIFTLASVACGIAANLSLLVLARILQGVGAAMLVPCALKLINHVCPEPEQRARAIGVWVGCGGIAMAAGPMVGGLLIQWFDWRSIFFVNLPIGVTGIAMAWRIDRERTPLEKRAFDPVGQVTAMVAVGMLIGVLIEGHGLGWRSPWILAAATTAIAAWVAFLTTEARHMQPMLPLSFFRNGIFAGSAFVSMVSAFVFYGLLFVMSLYYQQVRGYSPAQAGLAFLPMTAMVGAGSLLSNRMAKFGGVRGSMCVAFLGYAGGAWGLLSANAQTPYALAVAPMLSIGLASGFISPAATAPALGTVDKQRAGIAAAVLNAARQLGAALGVAVFGTVIAASLRFEQGMHTVLWAASIASLVASVTWLLALHPRVSAGKPAIKSAAFSSDSKPGP
jgi:MFS transporter, DHA2 family, methylenomycin A resistance protein